MDGSLDSPALALFNPPVKPALKNRPISQAPRHFISRSLHNLRQGNFALFIVFCGCAVAGPLPCAVIADVSHSCLVIFVRALFGAGYDEAYSADADAAVQKHPSLLSRWGPHSQHALEQQWKKLRGRSGTGTGLWAKIRKEDEGASVASTRVPGHDALHWLRVMEDKALVGFGRRAQDESAREDPARATDAPGPADAAAEGDVVADAVAQAPMAVDPPHGHARPEHDISEDLDEHDVSDEDDLRRAETPVVPVPVPVVRQLEEELAATAPANTPEASPEAQAEAAPAPDADPASPAIAAPQLSPASPEVDPEHDDTDDEPVYHRQEDSK